MFRNPNHRTRLHHCHVPADGRQASFMSVCWATICVGVMLTALIQAVGNNAYAVHHSNTAWSNTTRCMDTCLLNFQYRVETYDDSVSRLLSAGDVQPNPRPVQCPCGICGKGVRRNQRGIACDGCDKWHHAKCIDMTTAEYIPSCQTRQTIGTVGNAYSLNSLILSSTRPLPLRAVNNMNTLTTYSNNSIQ